ncbi:MAG: hypothetical protein OMM_07728 [Candidatus Magnetoglobus multicellularis str. Araruama]|uniref:Uncharacterized protein n=1 Tax=Candidatus Magnetoglobus multicellularis str. Araruama TaxID=890399 RepID=A0A1V1PAZ3_9BACT|nr:MAG: hypothetical protein OMM_07728 [Candidatus Magnetoglobus multicellularis str. Araruama]
MTACENSEHIDPKTSQLEGMALAGKPISGKVVVKDSRGNYCSGIIAADGAFNIDVTEMLPPFILWSKSSDTPSYYSTKKRRVMSMLIRQQMPLWPLL